MNTSLTLNNDILQKTSITTMSYDEQLSLLSKITEYKAQLDERYDYVIDVSSVQYPDNYTDKPGVISFGTSGVPVGEVLSFLHDINGRTTAKVYS